MMYYARLSCFPRRTCYSRLSARYRNRYLQPFSPFQLLLAAAGDIRMLVRGAVFGVKRIVRHLWRMCFGFFIATGSFFLGQQQVFPAWLRGSSVLFIPALLPLVLLIFWLFRVRFTNAYKRMSMPRGADVYSLPRPTREPDAGC